MRVEKSNRDGASEQEEPQRSALDRKAAAMTGMPILPDFSTNPLPKVKCIATKSGARLFHWNDDSVGLKSSCDITTGTINHGVPVLVDHEGRREVVVTSSVKNKASALLVLDLLIHRESFPGAQVECMVHEAMAETSTLEDARAGHQFAVEEGVANLGRADTINLAEFPQYRALLTRSTESVGWALSEFDAYRLRVPYPIMSAMHRLFFYDPVA
ncbi:MAG: hypothetical protein QM770_20620 [Tepidisphaeraceae bacterium]